MRRGYSLLELIVVITLVGILAAVGSVRFSTMQVDYRTKMTAELVRRTFDEVRQTAAARSTPITVTFLKNKRTFTVTGMDHPDKPGHPWEVNLQTFSPDAKAGDDYTVTFNGFGYPSAALVVELKIEGEKKYVRLNRDTGAATID